MIRIRNLWKSFGSYDVLAGVSLHIRKGEFVALLGANGAGKSTLMSCILGVTGYEGEIEVAGLDPSREGRRTRGMIGYMPQQGSLHTDLTTLETLDFYASFRRIRTDRMEMLREARLAEHAGKRVGELSGGMQQRLAFAIARLGKPPLLLLDEPSASLDRESKRTMLALLKELASGGSTILLATHLEQELAESADRFIVLEDGRLAGERMGQVA